MRAPNYLKGVVTLPIADCRLVYSKSLPGGATGFKTAVETDKLTIGNWKSAMASIGDRK